MGDQGKRETKTNRYTDRQTDRQTDRPTDRQMDKQKANNTNKRVVKVTQTDGRKDKLTGLQIDRLSS